MEKNSKNKNLQQKVSYANQESLNNTEFNNSISDNTNPESIFESSENNESDEKRAEDEYNEFLAKVEAEGLKKCLSSLKTIKETNREYILSHAHTLISNMDKLSVTRIDKSPKFISSSDQEEKNAEGSLDLNDFKNSGFFEFSKQLYEVRSSPQINLNFKFKPMKNNLINNK